MTNFGIDQVSSIPPKWWRKFERGLFIGVVPATTAFITQVVANPEKEVLYLTIISFATALIKSVGIFLGSGEEYPKSTTEENNNQ